MSDRSWQRYIKSKAEEGNEVDRIFVIKFQGQRFYAKLLREKSDKSGREYEITGTFLGDNDHELVGTPVSHDNLDY